MGSEEQYTFKAFFFTGDRIEQRFALVGFQTCLQCIDHGGVDGQGYIGE